MTVDHYPCTFPFWYAGKVHYKCTNLTRSDLPDGSQWCAIDSKILRFKSIGICSESCLQSKHFSCCQRILWENWFHSLNSVTENISIILIVGGEDEDLLLKSSQVRKKRYNSQYLFSSDKNYVKNCPTMTD